MGMETWSDIFSWVFPSTRYLAFAMIIIGCLCSNQKRNLGWHRLMRYTAFIYGTTYFYWNLISTQEDNLAKNHLTLDRSDFQELYTKYYLKSEGYLFKEERKNFFTNITASYQEQNIYIPDPLDSRFYEWIAYLVILAMGISGVFGIRVLKPWTIGHQFSILRLSFSLGMAPGIIGNGIICSVTYWYWANTKKASMIGKDVNIGSIALWVSIAGILLIDFWALIRHALVDTKLEVRKELEANKSKFRLGRCLIFKRPSFTISR